MFNYNKSKNKELKYDDNKGNINWWMIGKLSISTV